jgi:hypothetical protein
VAKIISFLMHPLFGMTYILVLLMLLHPFDFGVHHLTEKRGMIMLFGVIASTVLLPAAGILLLKPLGYLKSYETPERQERIGPYIITGMMYIWVYKNLSSGIGLAPAYNQIFMGATIALFIGFFINNWFKVSAHMNGLGGLVAAVCIITVHIYPGSTLVLPIGGQFLSMSMNVILILAVLLAGATAYARLALKAHTYSELSIGFLVGMVSQVIAMLIHA